jgi:L-ascorbate metabolism protein UlaG (beta-lactamase superfamily)
VAAWWRRDYGRVIAAAGIAVTFVGHACVALDVDGARLITDPVLRARVGYLRRVANLPAVDVSAASALLVSHVHHDHLDGPSLRRFPATTPVVAPAGARRLLRSMGVRAIVELLPGERAVVGGVPVTATRAEHAATRLPGAPRIPALGYLVGDGARAYFAGDTDLFDGMAAIGAAGLDVALLPVAGWGPRIPPGHLDPERAAAALALLNPRVAVPIHWGTLAPIWWRRRTAQELRAAPETFRRHAAREAPGVDVRILAPGQTLRVPSG